MALSAGRCAGADADQEQQRIAHISRTCAYLDPAPRGSARALACSGVTAGTHGPGRRRGDLRRPPSGPGEPELAGSGPTNQATIRAAIIATIKDAGYLHIPEGRRDHTTPAETLHLHGLD